MNYSNSIVYMQLILGTTKQLQVGIMLLSVLGFCVCVCVCVCGITKIMWWPLKNSAWKQSF